jgi:acyl-coenzyme A thioesterase PaaI-like protein
VTSPDPVSMLNAGLEQLIPIAHRMGVTFLELRPGFVRAGVPFEGNGNHFGTMYAGVIFTVAEVLGGAMHWATFDTSTHYPLVRALSIEFRAAARGPVTASASLDERTVARVNDEARAVGKAPFELRAEVVADDGTLVATTVGDYQLRPLGR